MSRNLIRPTHGRDALSVRPETMNWGHLGFAVQRLAAGDELLLGASGEGPP